MRLTHVSLLGLALVIPAIATAPKKGPALCGLNKLRNCAKKQICVKPSPTLACTHKNPDLCPGTCEPSCTLTSNAQPCPYGQRCKVLPGISIQQTGYCPAPTFCGGIANIQCPNRNDVCVDDPRDACDPSTTGRDCGGICVVPTKRLCDSRGLPPCFEGEICVHDPDSGCGAAQDCPGVCTTKRICATLAGLQCAKGERCVDDVSNADCTGGIAADCPGVCIPA